MTNIIRKHPPQVAGLSVAVVATLAMLAACSGGGGDGSNGTLPVPVATPPPSSSGQFSDVTAASGMSFRTGFLIAPTRGDYEVVAPSGVASGDFDKDGDIDLFMTRGDSGPNLLYRNAGNMTFEEVAASAGLAWTRSASENYRHATPMFADMDGDADLDLFLGGLDDDPSMIYRNNGDGTFDNVTAGSGIDTMNATYTIGAAFGDYDLDGDLDMFLAHWGTPRDHTSPGDTEHLWRNDSDATGIRFTSVSEAAGISPSIINLADPLDQGSTADYTFTPTFARINDDLYPDLLVVSDFNRSQYFVNNQDGTFSNATDVDVMVDGNGMGSAVGDYDNDGDLDWFVSSIEDTGTPFFADGRLSQIGNRLYRNDDGVYSDATDAAGVAAGGWGWGSCFVDIDNDSDLDIYHTNGFPLADAEDDWELDPSRVFISDGNGSFIERAAEFGLDDREQGRGVVCADFDNDGDVDILQMHRNASSAVSLFQNNGTANNHLKIRLNGLAPNTEAVGARILVTIGTVTQMREVAVASNFVSQNPCEQTIGLGAATQVDEVRIQWPDGSETVQSNVAAGQTLTVTQTVP